LARGQLIPAHFSDQAGQDGVSLLKVLDGVLQK
jgi:hypothetical protein